MNPWSVVFIGIGAVALIYTVNKLIQSLADARDTLEDILDATLDHTPSGGWTARDVDTVVLPEFREWDDELRDYILRKDET